MAGPAASVDSEKLLELGLDAANGDFRAPDFSLVTVDKGQVGLSQYRGKVVVLNFWTTW
jgi:peroxiredoxin